LKPEEALFFFQFSGCYQCARVAGDHQVLVGLAAVRGLPGELSRGEAAIMHFHLFSVIQAIAAIDLFMTFDRDPVELVPWRRQQVEMAEAVMTADE
jgi:hypothetical protein